jgi:hypothetical protein
MKLYHTTTKETAGYIKESGFMYGMGTYGFAFRTHNRVLIGVFFADRPLGLSEGAKGDPVLGDPVIEIEVDEDAIARYELVDSSLYRTYREWCLPTLIVERCPKRFIYGPRDDAKSEEWWLDV